MSFRPPPGPAASTPSTANPSSLPPRPPATSAPPNNAARPSQRPAFAAFAPRQVASRRPPSSFSQPSQPPSNAASDPAGTYGGPVIQNPFPLPGTQEHRNAAFNDPGMEAQIAQWQSAYNSAPAARPVAAPTATPIVPILEAPATTKKKTVVRSGGGTQWTDSSLLDWNPNHFRLFVGNLAGEVTDESLLKAFLRWTSVQKARVIRDKRTSKSKGYGFVSFSDGDDFFEAARDMQGKYIGSHPVLLRRATTDVKPVVQRINKNKNAGKKGQKGKSGSGMGAKSQVPPEDGAYAAAGIQKPAQKTKGGLRILG